MQLMNHPFIKKYEVDQQVDLAGFVQSVFDPTERLKDLSDVRSLYNFGELAFFPFWVDSENSIVICFEVLLSNAIAESIWRVLPQMLTVHYYMLFDGADVRWPHMKGLYAANSVLS